ncbi:MAG: VWA domain-containing protein [Oligoflexales bacterium]
MNFASPQYFYMFLCLPVISFLLFLASKKRRKRLKFFEKMIPQVTSSKPDSIKFLFWCLGLICLFIGVSRPRYGYQEVEIPKAVHDIMIVMDLSQSMLAQDIKPNRLERARRETLDLLNELRGHRVGLVVFAGEAFVHCPLTQDYDLVRDFVRQWSYDLPAVQGSLLGTALELAGDRLLAVKGERQRTILLLTDGEDHEGRAVRIAETLGEKNIKIHTIGMGENQSLIPNPSGGYKKDRLGNLIVSRIDEKALQKISSVTNGQYVRSRGDDFDLIKIFQDLKIQSEQQDTHIKKVWHERFQWFLALAFVFLVIESFIPSTFILLCICFSPLAKSAEWLPGEEGSGLYYYNLGDFQSAREVFEGDLKLKPNDRSVKYNLGIVFFRLGDFEKSKDFFSNVLGSDDLAKNARFNLGNTLVALGQLEEAAKVYKSMQEQGWDDEQVQENLQWVLKQLNQPSSEDQKSEDQKSEDQKSEDQKSEDQKSEDQKSEDQKSEDQKSEDQKSEDQKSEDEVSEDRNSSSEKLKEEASTEGSEEEESSPEGALKEFSSKDKIDQNRKNQKMDTDLKDIEKREALRILKKVDGNGVIKYRRRQRQTAPTKDW